MIYLLTTFYRLAYTLKKLWILAGNILTIKNSTTSAIPSVINWFIVGILTAAILSPFQKS